MALSRNVTVEVPENMRAALIPVFCEGADLISPTFQRDVPHVFLL